VEAVADVRAAAVGVMVAGAAMADAEARAAAGAIASPTKIIASPRDSPANRAGKLSFSVDSPSTAVRYSGARHFRKACLASERQALNRAGFCLCFAFVDSDLFVCNRLCASVACFC
jgi:hypothetical protein